jgi:putative spermidine/putrescine transport system substrate-binding protein
MWTPNPDVLAGAEGEVNIVAWPGYIEDGTNNPDADWVTPFTELTDCAVNVKLGATSDEMVQLMQSGEYDGVSASGDATNRLMAGGEVVAIDVAEFSSYEQIFDGLKDKPWNSLDGEPMGIPHGRGANLLFFNTEAFPDGLTSWGPMFESGSVADGAISIYDSPIYIADAAVWLMTPRSHCSRSRSRSPASTGPTTWRRPTRWSTARRWRARPGRSWRTTPRASAPRSTP